MHRFPLVLLAVLALADPASASGSDDTHTEDPPPPPEEPTSDIEWENPTLIVTAATPGTLELTRNPGHGSGPTIWCGYFTLVIDGTGYNDFVPVAPIIDETYLYICWTKAYHLPYPGYPIVVTYPGPHVPPGPVIVTEEAAQYAVDNINFQAPVVETAPASTHVVGVESWFAVTSQLDYAPVSAEAPPVWATVRPELRDVTWDLGNGDKLTCTTDATTRWNPDADGQHSDCTYAYESSPTGGDTFAASATITWTIWQNTDKTGGAWTTWGTVSLTTPFDIAVTGLQAVIH